MHGALVTGAGKIGCLCGYKKRRERRGAVGQGLGQTGGSQREWRNGTGESTGCVRCLEVYKISAVR